MEKVPKQKKITPKFEDIHCFKNLLSAAKKAIKSKGIHRREQAHFRVNIGSELLQLQQELKTQTYTPQPYRTFTVKDPKERIISAAPIRDRVLHHAVINIIGDFLEKSFIYHSYACRKEKGTHKAIKQAQKYCRRFQYAIHFDVNKFFDSIDHGILICILSSKIQDKKIRSLLETIITTHSNTITPGKSLPIGNLTSQYFANLYLNELDHFLKDQLGVKGYLRYMDNILIFHNNRDTLKEVAEKTETYCKDRLHLSLSSSGIQPVYRGVTFLGLRIFRDRLRICNTRYKRFKEKFKQKETLFHAGKLDEETFMNSAVSMINHLSFANTYRLRKPFFQQ